MAGNAQVGIMKRASEFVKFFIDGQRAHNVQETVNINEIKWFMKDLMDQLQDDALIRELLVFYFNTSESRTWNDFKWNYDAYLDAWYEYLNAYRRRLVLQQETVTKGKENS